MKTTTHTTEQTTTETPEQTAARIVREAAANPDTRKAIYRELAAQATEAKAGLRAAREKAEAAGISVQQQLHEDRKAAYAAALVLAVREGRQTVEGLAALVAEAKGMVALREWAKSR